MAIPKEENLLKLLRAYGITSHKSFYDRVRNVKERTTPRDALQDLASRLPEDKIQLLLGLAKELPPILPLMDHSSQSLKDKNIPDPENCLDLNGASIYSSFRMDCVINTHEYPRRGLANALKYLTLQNGTSDQIIRSRGQKDVNNSRSK